ncbi:hypothetical protein DFH07DRAFT_392648 [Mycena maculata]|uniref:Uncharacterized protein n=1 Tax=Mycena maculata TaxID=230809 RepID=A0AAD7KB74_9AGAR|nr:hypothetical protein DFH07DRAFT_392648 [Mycena maculata]
MGRALFSETYGFKAPAIRVEPEPICPTFNKWSVYNRFDPDSDEFFEDAEWEAFVDKEAPNGLEHPVADAQLQLGQSSPSSGSDTESDRGSPILDLPARSIPMNIIWDRLVDESAAAVGDEQVLADIPGYARADEPDDRLAIRATADSGRAVTVSVASPIHPPSALRNSTTATDLAPAIAIPVAPSTPGPESPVSPSTPPSVYTHLQMMTPSPPPTVTPRIYMWGPRTHVPASPGSPSVRHTHSAGPLLSNPGARQSLARLPTRRRVQNV